MLYGLFAFAQLPQTGGQTLPGPHIGTGFQNPPEVSRFFFESLFSQRSLSGLYTFFVEVFGFLEALGTLFSQKYVGVGTIRRNFQRFLRQLHPLSWTLGLKSL